jgi:UDP-N-acetylglucosamine 1-carboxyvinyltransferase
MNKKPKKSEKKINNTDHTKIGYLIKQLREKNNLTQSDFAKLLKTSQSAVARMESGGQNFTTKELFKISEVLDTKIIEISNSTDFKVRGGRKLHGSVDTNTSKNGALALMMTALLNKGKTILHDVPRIEEINRVIEVFEETGIHVNWIGGHDLEIRLPKKINKLGLMSESSRKIRSGLMMIAPLLHLESEFKMPNAGGCKMGERTISAHKMGLEELGVKIKVNSDNYEISKKKLKPAEVIMYEMSDTATINVILMAALIPGKTEIKFASANYHVQDTCYFLQKMGVNIEGIGTTNLIVNGVKEINQDVEYYVSEDPIESMMFLSAAIMTNSEITICRCPIDFLALELLKLKKMGFKYTQSKVYKSKDEKTKLVDIVTKPSKLKALPDKIHALPYPGINTDNLPFFAAIATQVEGQTMIHDWMWENRAVYFTELNKLGARVDLADPHRVYIHGKTELKPAQIVCPPALRPATIILVAMLAAKGESILRNVYSIMRGYEEVAERLNKLGADIEVIKDM